MCPGNPAASILISCSLSAHGGNETHVTSLCVLFRAAGHAVAVATRSRDFARHHGRRLSEIGVKVITTPFGDSAPGVLRNLWAAAIWPAASPRRLRTHLIAVGPGGFHRLMIGRIAPGGTSLYWEAGDGLGARTPAQLRMLASMDGLAATSGPVAARMSAALGRRVEVLPPLTLMPAAAKVAFRSPPGRRVQVGFVGRVSRQKGVDLLLRAWSEVAGDGADLHLHGDGPEAPEMAALAKTLGVAGAARFHGSFDRDTELADVMASLDLLVLPSLSEGLPHVLVEALAHGLPFVATDVGGISDLGHGNPGAILVEPTAESVAGGLREAIRRIQGREVGREKILSFYRERYAPEVVGARWLAALGLGHDVSAPALLAEASVAR